MSIGDRRIERGAVVDPERWSELGAGYFEYHDLLPSTNDRLRELAASGAPFYSVVIAGEQSQGRGRGGKRWYSAPGSGLWISVLLRLPSGESGGGVGVLPLAVGVAAARAVEGVAGVRVSLKWPNDLLISMRKVGGILCESVPRGGEDAAGEETDRGGRAVVAGVGIDLRRPIEELPAELAGGVSFLEEECGSLVAEPRLAAELLAELRRWTDPPPLLLEGELRREWEARDALVGLRVRVDDGGKMREGTVRGVSPSGMLLLEGDGEAVEEVRSGTVRALPPETG